MNKSDNKQTCAVTSVPFYFRKQRQQFQDSDNVLSTETHHGIQLNFLRENSRDKTVFDTSRRYHSIGGGGSKYLSDRVWANNKSKLIRYAKGKFSYSRTGSCNQQIAGVSGPRLKSNPLPLFVSKVKHNDVVKKEVQEPKGFWADEYDADEDLIEDEVVVQPAWTYTAFLSDSNNRDLAEVFSKKQIKRRRIEQVKDLCRDEDAILADTERQLLKLGSLAECAECCDGGATPANTPELPFQQGISDWFIPSAITTPLGKMSSAAESVSGLVETVQRDRANLFAGAESIAKMFFDLGMSAYKFYDLRVAFEELGDETRPVWYRWARVAEGVHAFFKRLFPEQVTGDVSKLIELDDIGAMFGEVEKQGSFQLGEDVFGLVGNMFGVTKKTLDTHSILFRNFNTAFSFVKNAKTLAEKIWSAFCTAGLYLANVTNCQFMSDWILSFEAGKMAEFGRLYCLVEDAADKVGRDMHVDTALMRLKELREQLSWFEPSWDTPAMREFDKRCKMLEKLWALHYRRTELVYGRITPFCYCVFGASDVGKTSMMDLVTHRALSTFPIESRCHWVGDGDYMDGIPENVQALGLDDWAGEYDFDPHMLLVLKTSINAPLNMAFELKGKIYFTGSMLMLNTNTPYPPMSHIMNNPEAVLRRRDLLIEMAWKSDAEVDPISGKRVKKDDWSHAEFYVWHSEDPTVPRKGPFNFEEMQERICVAYDVHVKKETRFRELKKQLFPPSCTPRDIKSCEIDMLKDIAVQQLDFTKVPLQNLFKEVAGKWSTMSVISDTTTTGLSLMRKIEGISSMPGIDGNAITILTEMANQVFYFTKSGRPKDISDKVNALRKRLFMGADLGEMPSQEGANVWETMAMDATLFLSGWALYKVIGTVTKWLFNKDQKHAPERDVHVEGLVKKYDLPPEAADLFRELFAKTGTKEMMTELLALNPNDPDDLVRMIEGVMKFHEGDTVQLRELIRTSCHFDDARIHFKFGYETFWKLHRALDTFREIEKEGAYSQEKVRVKRVVQRRINARAKGLVSKEGKLRAQLWKAISKEGVRLPKDQVEGMKKAFPRVASCLNQPEDKPETEGFTDPSAAVMAQNLVKQLGRVRFVSGAYENRMNFIPIVGTVILVPRHLLVPTGSAELADSGVMYLEQYTSAGTKFSKPVVFYPERVAFVRKHEVQQYGVDTDEPCPLQSKGERCGCHIYDWVLYDCGKSSVVTYGDHRKLFVRDTDLDHIRGIQSGTLVVKRDGGVTEIEPQDIRPIDRPVVTRTHEGSGIEKIVEGWQYSAGTQPGDCGAPLLVHNTQVQPGKIVGIHTAAFRNASTAYATIVTQDLIELAMADLPVPIVISGVPEVEGCVLREYVTGDVFPIGTVSPKKAISVPTKTDYYPSPIQGEFVVLKEPSILSNRDERYTERNGDVFANAMQKFGGERVQPSKSDMLHLRSATALLTQFFETFPRREKPRVWTIEEALNGIGNVNRINLHSSAGWPFSLPENKGQEKGKHAYIDSSGPVLRLKPVMMEAVALREQAASKGVRVPSVWTANLKNELRNIPRVRSGKTRGFVGCPLDYTIVFRKYFGAWIDFMHSHYIENMCGVGMNCESSDWTLLANKIRAVATHFFAFDYTDWDGSLLPEVLWEAKELIQSFYGAAWTQVHEVLYDEIVNTTMIMFNEIIMKRNSIPSGVPCTAEINCLINLLLIVAYYMKSRPQKPTLKNMLEELYVCVYGDDNVGGVSDYASTFMSPLGYEEFIKGFGMTVTNASKDGMVSWEKFENLTFLKRHFRQEGLTFLPLIDLKTISGMITWLTDRSEDALETNINTALRYMFFFGGEIFSIFREDVLEACRKNGQRVCINTYQELYEEYYGNNQFSTLVPWLNRI